MALLLIALGIALAARGLHRHTTWYLASDQFAFVTFADDLAAGRVFHDPSAVAWMANPALPRSLSLDAYYQTYFYRDGRVYTRYPPGYPLLLAAAKLVGGETAVHALNPLLYLVLLVVLATIAAMLVRADLRWPAAAMIVWLMLLLPVDVHYWALTVSRDLPAHLLALGGLLAASRRATALAGLALGLAASMRPDAVLWLPALQLACPREARSLRAMAISGGTFLIGAAPVLAYNTITGGNPLAFTQGGEFRHLFTFSSAAIVPDPAAINVLSGGGFRLDNLRTTLPAHLHYLAESVGLYLAFAGVGWWTAPRASRGVVNGLAVYGLIGLAFYSCWGHGDPRYLVGVVLGLMLSAAAGMVTTAAWLSTAPPRRRAAALLAIVFASAVLHGVGNPDPTRQLGALEMVGIVAFVVAATLRRRGRGLAALAPVVAFAVVGIARFAGGTAAASDAYGAEDVARARAVVGAALPPGSLLLVSPVIGRPAENIAHYVGREAIYLGELYQLGVSPADVARRGAREQRPIFLLLGAVEELPPPSVRVREVARIPQSELRAWFVDPNRVVAGAVLYAVEDAS